MFSVAPRSRKKLDAETRALSTAGWSLSQQACSLHMLSFLDLSSPSLEDNNDFHNYHCVLCYENLLHIDLPPENDFLFENMFMKRSANNWRVLKFDIVLIKTILLLSNQST